MRVLVLSHSSAVDNLGGAERSMVDFLDEWRSAVPELEVFVISRSPEGHLQPELEERGIPWMNLPFYSWVSSRRATTPEEIYDSARSDFAAVRAIERFIVEFNPDLVITNTIVAPWAAIAAKLAKVPHIWFAREYGDGHEFGIPREQVFEDIGLLSDLVVANSGALRDFLTRWISPQKLTVLYPTLHLTADDASMPVPDQNWPLPSSSAMRDLRLISVGRIMESKGQLRLVRAVASLKDEGTRVEAAIVGSAAEADRVVIERLIEDLGVGDRVVLTGEVKDPQAFIAAADVGVVASDSEGFGRVTVEYMAAGKAVIGARVGATMELVDDGRTGALFTPGDVAALAQAIRTYVDDREAVSAHGHAGSRKLSEEVVHRHRLATLLPEFDRVVDSGSGPLLKLPNIFASWMTLPDTIMDVLTTSGAMVNPETSRTWRAGELVLALPRRAAVLFRRARVRS